MSKESRFKYQISTDKQPTKFIVYKAITPNEKNYVGITRQKFIKRLSDHLYSANSNKPYLISRSINKYGMENIKWFIIDYADSIEELQELEKHWIKKLNTYAYNNKKGLNTTLGGEGVNGYELTEEQRIARSERHKLWYKNNPDKKEEASELLKGFREDPEWVEYCRNKMKEHHSDPEFIEKMSKSAKKAYENNPELRDLQRNIKIQYYSKPEIHEKHSDIMKEYYVKHPETIQKRLNTMEDYFNDKDYRVKLSVAHNSKPFNVYNKFTGEFIGQWIAHSICAEELKINRTQIVQCLKNRCNYIVDYIVIYVDEDDPEKLQEKLNIIKQSNFNVYDKENKYIMTIDNQKRCADLLNLNASNISNCLHGRAKSHKGYTFYYANNNPHLEELQQSSSFSLASK
jgi:group I intron endonuclease